MELKPIETYYKGYRFRSRLEARWAVFFDAMRINYVYEPEGFNLNGEYYLPDFYLSDYEIYIEIKPFDKSVMRYVGDHNKWEKKCALFRDVVGKAILICYNEPAADLSKVLFAWDNGDGSAGACNIKVFFSNDGDILAPPSSHEICVTDYFKTNRFVRNASDDEWYEHTNYLREPDDSYKLGYAMLKSRQARFEHGEKP